VSLDSMHTQLNIALQPRFSQEYPHSPKVALNPPQSHHDLGL